MIRLICSILLFLNLTSCTFKRAINVNSCESIYSELEFFASKFKPIGNNCFSFKFDLDTTKYLEYGKLHGSIDTELDYRYNELFYFISKLTNEFENLSAEKKECLDNLTRNEIFQVFGRPTGEGFKYSSEILYVFPQGKNCSLCNESYLARDRCESNIRFVFSEKNKLKGIRINITVPSE